MPATTPTQKRIVFMHDDGIHQILGVHAGELPVTLVPEGATAILVRDKIIPFASLVRVTSRAAYYKMPMQNVPAQTFSEAQR